MTLKIAALAPIPIASVNNEIAVNRGDLASLRNVYIKIFSSQSTARLRPIFPDYKTDTLPGGESLQNIMTVGRGVRTLSPASRLTSTPSEEIFESAAQVGLCQARGVLLPCLSQESLSMGECIVPLLVSITPRY